MATKKQPTIRRLSQGGPLHDLLLEICPPNKEGVKSITVLAEKMGLSSQAVYGWIDNGRIPASRAKKLTELSKGRVTLEKIVKFVVR